MARQRPLKIVVSSASSLGKFAFRTTEALFDHALKWSTTDHLGSRHLSRMPRMGFWASLSYIAMTLFAGLVGAAVAGILTYLGIAYVIPAVLSFAFGVFFR